MRRYKSGVLRPAIVIAVLALTGLLAAGSSLASRVRADAGSRAAAWVDQPVSFRAGGVMIYATFRHRRMRAGRVPAALLIAGSGPTDRNGNSSIPGFHTVNTLKTLAGWLSADGVASLRYDKLGSGRTGLGRYAAHPERIGIGPYEQEAAAALSFLGRQRGVDRHRLAVLGHSEGALFAVLLATGAAGRAPRVRALGLLEPLPMRYLDLFAIQIKARMSAALRAGHISASEAASIERSLGSAIHSVRTTGKVPSNLPDGLSTVLNRSNALFLSQADRHDPAKSATRLGRHFPVLVSCSDADVQVTCGEVRHLLAGLAKTHANTAFVRLRGVDHVLKQDPSSDNYGAPLPFSRQLQTALRRFVHKSF